MKLSITLDPPDHRIVETAWRTFYKDMQLGTLPGICCQLFVDSVLEDFPLFALEGLTGESIKRRDLAEDFTFDILDHDVEAVRELLESICSLTGVIKPPRELKQLLRNVEEIEFHELYEPIAYFIEQSLHYLYTETDFIGPYIALTKRFKHRYPNGIVHAETAWLNVQTIIFTIEPYYKR